MMLNIGRQKDGQGKRDLGNRIGIQFNKDYCDIKESSCFWLERTPQCTVEEMADKVERYFGLESKDIVTYGNGIVYLNSIEVL